jgi:DnaJ-class molecular chaperone
MSDPEMHPGDEASPDEASVGEDVCEKCGGSGQVDGRECPECAGTGVVQRAVGGG